MANLLIIDPLNLRLKDGSGAVVWSSGSCFEESFEGYDLEICRADDPDLCRKALDADGVVLGGSERSAWEDTAFNDQLIDVIAICRNTEIPFLGICFGAQLLGRALGARVGKHPDGMELGEVAIRLSEKGRQHFLFSGVQGTILKAVESHSDAVLTLPPECTLLASTEHTPVQAFGFGELLTGVQFHPEMSGEDLRCLWTVFESEDLAGPLAAKQRQLVQECSVGRLVSVFEAFAHRVAAAVRV